MNHEKIVLALSLIFTIIIAQGQTPNSFKYQALARTASGEVMVNESVEFTISILEDSIVGEPVYSETQNVTTNQFGLVSFIIGKGTNPTSIFAEIDWTSGIYFIEIKLNGNLIGTSKLLSVPFAKYADKAGNTFSGDYNDLSNQPDLGLKLDTSATVNWDKDASNDFSGNYNDLHNKPQIIDSALIAKGLILHSNSGKRFKLNVDDNGNLITEEIFDLIDIDGNGYYSVTIGTQVWMKNNLKTTHYNDGEEIKYVTDINEWDTLTSGAYCWYNNNDTVYKNDYGALYNWFTVSTEKVCPIGWHVPTKNDWLTLINYLGGESIAGGKLKNSNGGFWTTPNVGATNESGFSALPGGIRLTSSSFTYINENAYFFSSDLGLDDNSAWIVYLTYNSSEIFIEDMAGKLSGRSIRCIKDIE